jgi:glutaredoxin
MTENDIIIYGAFWCGDCRRVKKFLDDNRIKYTWINIDKNKDAETIVKRLNNGFRIIPTIIFLDGTFLAEPTNLELENKLIELQVIEN